MEQQPSSPWACNEAELGFFCKKYSGIVDKLRNKWSAPGRWTRRERVALSGWQQWPCCPAPGWAGVSFPRPGQDFLLSARWGCPAAPSSQRGTPCMWLSAVSNGHRSGGHRLQQQRRSAAPPSRSVLQDTGPMGAGQGALARAGSEPRAGALTPAPSPLFWICVSSAGGSSGMPPGLSCLGQPDPWRSLSPPVLPRPEEVPGVPVSLGKQLRHV